MIFGLQNIDNIESALLAHALSLSTIRLRKGHVLTVADIELCRQAQLTQLIVAKLEADDVPEDVAAQTVACKLTTTSIRAGDSRTGRANLYATGNGVLVYDAAALARFNAIDEGLTLALSSPFTPVRKGQMIGTVKIIPFALAKSVIDRGVENCTEIQLNVHIYQPKSATLIQTSLPDIKASVRAKTVDVTRHRLQQLDSHLIDGGHVQHTVEALTTYLHDTQGDIILIVGASAIADRADVIPASIVAAGGSVMRVGLPVDPGNLLCLGRLGAALVIGLPGCARSPKRNGLDMVLERYIAGLHLDADTIATLGGGGLLEDVAERALPRVRPEPLRIGAILLAAGRSIRMGADNKLLLPTPTGPLVRRTAEAVRAAGIDIIAVLGHQAESVGQALHGAALHMLYNPDHAVGMATSIRTGLLAAPAHWDGAFIILGDMPLVSAASITSMVAVFDPAQGRGIIVPMIAGKRANPVLWAREYWPQLTDIKGDIGGKTTLAAAGDAVFEVMLEDEGLLMDVDDPASWQRIKALL